MCTRQRSCPSMACVRQNSISSAYRLCRKACYKLTTEVGPKYGFDCVCLITLRSCNLPDIPAPASGAESRSVYDLSSALPLTREFLTCLLAVKLIQTYSLWSASFWLLVTAPQADTLRSAESWGLALCFLSSCGSHVAAMSRAHRHNATGRRQAIRAQMAAVWLSLGHWLTTIYQRRKWPRFGLSLVVHVAPISKGILSQHVATQRCVGRASLLGHPCRCQHSCQHSWQRYSHHEFQHASTAVNMTASTAGPLYIRTAQLAAHLAA